ncbi:MAG: DDE-type integrase/transposase/recombinase [Deltaproteobacteria bacterium]|nr:DDE-type integrase/transposase/recombinase [Deltaproteobacteria bacterium]
MKPLKIPDARGKASKITTEIVRQIVREATVLKEQRKRLRLKGFTRHLKTKHDICLSRTKVKEILIANNLFAARTRKRRPSFYQSLRKEIPNGLVSLDGSEYTMLIDQVPYKFNVELCVDVCSFAHTAFSVGDSENSDEIINVLETHVKNWGNPLGVLCDHGSSNLSEQTQAYLENNDIELVPVGPANPKGNGTDEGAFSQMKQVLGTIHLETLSPKQLARAILEKMISIYITMRNRSPSKSSVLTPQETMKAPECQVKRDLERQRLKAHNNRRRASEEDQKKLDRLSYLIRYHGICPESAALKRAERTIKAFELKAIGAAEQAFHRAVTRNPQKTSLPYFFGILKNIQQERDDVGYKSYCYQRYNEQLMFKLKQQQEQIEQPEYSIETVVGILIQAVRAKILVVKELAIKKARQWTHELMASYSYPGALKKRFADAIGALTDLSIDLKNKIWELIEQFLNVNPTSESVTHFS